MKHETDKCKIMKSQFRFCSGMQGSLLCFSYLYLIFVRKHETEKYKCKIMIFLFCSGMQGSLLGVFLMCNLNGTIDFVQACRVLSLENGTVVKQGVSPRGLCQGVLQ